MAKKVVATLKSGKGKDFTKVIKMVKSDKTGAYNFKEEMFLGNKNTKLLSEGQFAQKLKQKKAYLN